jgi:hypothetical protein
VDNLNECIYICTQKVVGQKIYPGIHKVKESIRFVHRSYTICMVKIGGDNDMVINAQREIRDKVNGAHVS